MQKRKLLLSLVALCSIVGMGITSCNNEPVQGPQGEQGPVGPQGPAGENGENGEDGSLILHGEGKPADSLGKDTDVYIDSKTGDLYQKENGSWTLVMNIKGEDGEDGQDGSNGSSGSDGQDGETAYSNTILPSEFGYVVPSIGSGVEGTAFTFNIVPEGGYYLTDLKLNGKSIETTDTNLDYDSESKTYTYETTMPKNGYVVLATFSNEQGSNYIDGTRYDNSKVDPYGNVILKGTLSQTATFGGGSNTLDDPLLVTNSVQVGSIISSSVGKYFKFDTNLTSESLYASNKVYPTEKVIDLNGHTLKLTSPKYTGLFVSNGSKITIKNGTIKANATGVSAIYIGKETDESFTGGTLILDGVTLESAGGGIGIASKNSTVIIKNSTIKATSSALGTNAKLDSKVTDVNITIDSSTITTDGSDSDTKDSAAMMITVNANVNITNNSYIEGTKQSLIVRGGNVTISDSTIAHSHTYSGNELYEDGDWGSGNAVPYSAIVVGDTSATSYNYDATLTLNNVKFVDSGEEVEGRTYYQVYVYDDGTYKATLNIDEASYATFDPSKIYVREDSELSVINRN